MKLNWNFQRGGEVLEKILSVGEVWIFSGTTQCVLNYVEGACKLFTLEVSHVQVV